MTRKIKVVDIENVELPETVEIPEAVETPTPELISDDQQPQEETDIEEVEQPKESNPKKQDEKITCSVCNKTMLMKTYKYTHQKLCKPKEPEQHLTKSHVLEPPKEEKPKAKKLVKQKEISSQPSNIGLVSFTEYKENIIPDPLEIYRAAKEQRQQVRTQRVKSLISQAV